MRIKTTSILLSDLKFGIEATSISKSPMDFQKKSNLLVQFCGLVQFEIKNSLKQSPYQHPCFPS